MDMATTKQRSFTWRDQTTAAVLRGLARMTPYLESEVNGLSRIVEPGYTCIDVGAAEGNYTLELSRLVGPKGLVVSVEPLSFARPVWTKVLGTKSLNNVMHFGVALGAEPGRSQMSVPARRFGKVTGRSFLESRAKGLGSNQEFPHHEHFDTEVETLDGLCARLKLNRLDFIKVDVEGAELQVLVGGTKYIQKYHPTLLLEIEARHIERFSYSVDDILSWLVNKDYEMYIWDKGWHKTDKVSDHCRNYLFTYANRYR
jgi:FkbM family methyltransferase